LGEDSGAERLRMMVDSGGDLEEIAE